MKYLALLSMAVLLFASCDNFEDKDSLSPEVEASNEGVRFFSGIPDPIEIVYNDLDFGLTVIRNGKSSAIEVPITLIGDNGAYFNVPEVVSFPAGEDTVVVNFSATEAAPLGENIDLELELELAEEFMNPYMTELPYLKTKVYIKPPCAHNELRLSITFDDYSSETSWEILDAEEEVVASGGGFEDGQAPISVDLCLEDGSYTLVVNDSYGDGMGAPGLVTLTFGEEVLAEVEGDFGESTSLPFSLGEVVEL